MSTFLRTAQVLCVNNSAFVRPTEPKVLDAGDVPGMKWNPPDTEGLVKFLVEEKSFNEDRVRKAVERINASRGKSNQGAASRIQA